jgi:hypothetical protein
LNRFWLLVGAGLVLVACSAAPSPAPTSVPTFPPASLHPTVAPTEAPATTAVPSPTPVTGAGICPDDSTLTIAMFVEAEPECFGSSTIELRGWLDRPPDTGFLPPFVEPGWLDVPAHLATLWAERPVEPAHLCAPTAEVCAWFWLHVDPASGVSLESQRRWVQVTGHLDDPAAATCRYVYPDDWTEPRLDDAWAVEACRTKFVVDSFANAP